MSNTSEILTKIIEKNLQEISKIINEGETTKLVLASSTVACIAGVVALVTAGVWLVRKANLGSQPPPSPPQPPRPPQKSLQEPAIEIAAWLTTEAETIDSYASASALVIPPTTPFSSQRRPSTPFSGQRCPSTPFRSQQWGSIKPCSRSDPNFGLVPA